MARILIMEDDNEFREMLREMLEVGGYEVVEALDGEIGVALYRKDPADLIIIDIYMPWKEGLESIIELRRDYPDAKIIAISGGGKMGYLEILDQAEIFGAQKSLSKPFERQELLEYVRELLNQP